MKGGVGTQLTKSGHVVVGLQTGAVGCVLSELTVLWETVWEETTNTATDPASQEGKQTQTFSRGKRHFTDERRLIHHSTTIIVISLWQVL